LQEAAREGVDVDPVPGEELQQLAAEIRDAPPDVQALVQRIWRGL
jgi:hypothetical protein